MFFFFLCSNNWCFQEHVTAVDSSFVVSFGWLESPFDEGVMSNTACLFLGYFFAIVFQLLSTTHTVFHLTGVGCNYA